MSSNDTESLTPSLSNLITSSCKNIIDPYSSDSELSQSSSKSGVVINKNNVELNAILSKLISLKQEIKFLHLAVQVARYLIDIENMLNTAGNEDELFRVQKELLKLLDDSGAFEGQNKEAFNKAVALPNQNKELDKVITYFEDLRALHMDQEPSQLLNSIVKEIEKAISNTETCLLYGFSSKIEHYLLVKYNTLNDIIENMMIILINLIEYFDGLDLWEKNFIKELIAETLVPVLEHIFRLEIGIHLCYEEYLEDVESVFEFIKKHFPDIYNNNLDIFLFSKVGLLDACKHVQELISYRSLNPPYEEAFCW